MLGRKNTLLFVAVFVFGLIAGLGIGIAYGSNVQNAQLERQVSDSQARLTTINDNYLILVREYNKLFTLRGSVVETTTGSAPAPSSSAAPTVNPAQAPAFKPTVASTVAPAAIKPTVASTVAPAATKPTVASTVAPAATKPTVAPTAAVGKIKAEFKGEAIGGTGPQEGAPPLPVKFTDLSTGTITSWKWDFGDGSTSTEKNPEHIYRDCPGDKKLCTVKLTVCGADGCVTTTKPDYLWVSESCTGC